MKLAITTTEKVMYSETFIAMQMRAFPEALRIYGCPVPNETEPGGVIRAGELFRKLIQNPRGLIEGLRNEDSARARAVKLWRLGSHEVLRDIIKKRRIEVVLSNFGPSAVAMLPVCKSLKIPLVVHFHGADAHAVALLEEYHWAYQQLGYYASAVVAVSEMMRVSLQRVGIPKSKIVVMRYGVDLAAFNCNRETSHCHRFFGLGRFVDKKAPYLTLLAFKKVYDEYPDARLVLAGDGPLLEATVNIARALGVSQAVEFPGILTHQQVARQMRDATAFVQHSIRPEYGPSKGDSEGTPVAVLEAMASSLPIVATRHAGVGEVLEHEVSGLLVEERDVDGMARQMARLIRDRALALRLGDAARRKAEAEYSEQVYIGGLERLLSDAVGVRVPIPV